MMLRLISLLSISLIYVNSLDLPIVLPPFGTDQADVKSPDASWGTCLLYLESINVIVYNKKEKTGYVARVDSDEGEQKKKNTYTFDKSYVKCANISQELKDKKRSENSFTVDVTLGQEVQVKDKDTVQFSLPGPIKLTLQFATFPTNDWNLTSIKLEKDLVIKKGAFGEDFTIASGATANPLSVRSMGVGGFNGYNFACSNTKFAVFTLDKKDYEIGISFGNLQVQNDGYAVSKDGKTPQFTHNVNDCIGTFSAGSWMGILVTILLGSVLIFGFLMLNSVQSTDRFDDPKQKQLIINSKD
ncbi:unnamed protein product [Bursaphelenchus xylophilus]|uniref:(pine wood nematode) hypothetical protein n=1 Tax=Bursaphelenchus xylophilus TaxID=6326 RepID=A0A1I7S3U2_BURXY|nr:unnamed protein product [Bursaphelenchus xylophilus]CAG9116514.1 unnamed protein product [Bursaphelenchus xylophilus]